MSLEDPESIADLLRIVLDARANEINTSIPARVLRYDVEKQTVDVRIAVKRPVQTEDGEPESEVVADLMSVPLSFPRIGQLVFHMPVDEGDYVLLLFSQWSISQWRRGGGDSVDPGDARMHSLASPVAIAGVYPQNAAIAGLSASAAILGVVTGPNITVSTAKVKIGNPGPTMKRAARIGDPVTVTLPTGSVVIATADGPASNAAPITGDYGVIGPGGGSSVVDISD